MKYYYHPGSPNCRKVSAVIEMLGVDAKYEFVDLPKGKQAQPEFLAVNPNGMVPALVDGDTTVLESNCIIIYLAEKTGSDLWPEDAPSRDPPLDVLGAVALHVRHRHGLLPEAPQTAARAGARRGASRRRRWPSSAATPRPSMTTSRTGSGWSATP